MILKVFSSLLLVTLIGQAYALQCYTYECRGESCKDFQESEDKTSYIGTCPSQATGCRHIRGEVTAGHQGEAPPPPVLERRDCWTPGMNGMQADEDTCAEGGGWNEFWSREGKRWDVDIQADQCLCFSNLCNGKDLPSPAGNNVGQIMTISCATAFFVAVMKFY